MKIIAYFLGFAYIALGSTFILYTRQTFDVLKAMTRTLPFKILSILPAFFGILFLIAASQTTFPWFLRIIGLLALGKAALIFTDPRNLYTRMFNWYFQKVSDQAQRLFGIIAIILGAAILSWIR